MKKVCFVAYVFGGNYQEYIPLYTLFAGKTYPDYDLRIYIDYELKDNVKKQISYLKQFYNVEIIENFEDRIAFSKKALSFPRIKKSTRWLFYDKAFENYEALYIGDIDLIICKEPVDLFDAHMRHCEYLGTPYSNILRISKEADSCSPKGALKNIIEYGFRETIKYYKEKSYYVNKISGLHFVKTKEYYDAVTPKMQELINELNLMAESKSEKFNNCNFRDEELLYRLILESGLKLPTDSTGTGYNKETNPETDAYRPHHGLHLGIFRFTHAGIREYMELVGSNCYKNYYKYFKEIQKSEEYKYISEYFDKSLNSLIDNMDKFYSEII